MKRDVAFIVLLGLIISPAFGRGFLSAQTFPKTFQDLSFADRMAVLQEGYEIYETQYDANGVCISGCAYQGITIADDMAAVDDATTTMQDILANAEHSANVDGSDWCNNGKSPKLPLRPPVDISKYNVSSDFGWRKLGKENRFHPAVDIATPIGTSVYATADGVVTVGFDNAGGGKYINIQHDNGLVSQYLHLSKILVKNGDKVSACQEIAKSGNTGNSTGPHLDYRVRFNSASNSFVDLLCPCRASDRGSGKDVNVPNTISTCEHSIFYDNYRFSDKSDKHDVWREQYGHCLPNNTPGKNAKQLPDELM